VGYLANLKYCIRAALGRKPLALGVGDKDPAEWSSIAHDRSASALAPAPTLMIRGFVSNCRQRHRTEHKRGYPRDFG
jgi:hypothetical protein